MKKYYTEYVYHCLRFYARYHDGANNFRSDVDRKNWVACDKVLSRLRDEDKKMVVMVFQSRDSIADSVYETAKLYRIDQNHLWKILSEIESKIAKSRGLI